MEGREVEVSGFKFTGFPSSLKSESIRETGWLFKGLAAAHGLRTLGGTQMVHPSLRRGCPSSVAIRLRKAIVFYPARAGKMCYNMLGEILAGF